eukprot:gnl/MRDRNA2_/MRDRNA2_28287_c0_seq1.p1 gnl/MRDRNA2_/MRDRNA2_28287_c0~~gnl/MRDRNA2_/MRDRNA2_28287_c0_seq1.p1  ORF type:complete len:456 (+),score=129.83 gnl/MRDRNA2_/MRDRNA2_28287_c0_seq1:57-1424(+)
MFVLHDPSAWPPDDSDLKAARADERCLIQEEAAGHTARIAELLRDPSKTVRCYAANSLGLLGEGATAHLDDLAAALADEDESVRASAAEALGRIGEALGYMNEAGDGAPHSAEVAALLRDGCWAVRRAAADALRRMGPQAAPDAAAILTDPDPFARTAAAAALSGSEDHPQLMHLAQLLGDPEHGPQRAAVEALVCCGAAGATAAAEQLDPANSVRARTAAAEALGLLGPFGLGYDTELVSALQDEDARLRAAAAQSLGQVGAVSPNCVNALLNALRDDEVEVRCAAATAFGAVLMTGNEASLITTCGPPLAECLQDLEFAMRHATAETLGQLGASDFAKRLRYHSKPEVREALVTALALDADIEAQKLLQELAKDRNFTVQNAALKALQCIEGADGLEAAKTLNRRQKKEQFAGRSAKAMLAGGFTWRQNPDLSPYSFIRAEGGPPMRVLMEKQ